MAKEITKQTALAQLGIPESERLADNASWTNRFQVKSATSERLYTIAQSKSGRFWSCSCFGNVRHKHCKHLQALGLPGNYQAFEPNQLDYKE